MMRYGYNPMWSEGAIKCPIFQTSTFVFESAEHGKAFFELALGKREPGKHEHPGLIYSRLNNPDLEILEDRLTLWDQAEAAAVFESGMAAITTTLLELVSPGQIILHSDPLYGGTNHFIRDTLKRFNIHSVSFPSHWCESRLMQFIEQEGLEKRIGAIFLETPANPTNELYDIEMCARVATLLSTEEHDVFVLVDNTFLGPLWQHPLKHGADVVLYSATKYIGGHSDVVAGAALGSKELIHRIKGLRHQLGGMCGPMTGWLLMRSLETLKVRMERQQATARKVANFLASHPSVALVHYLDMLDPNDDQYRIYTKQCLGSGAMISFEIKGGEAEAFRFLNRLQLFHLAVSLGSTESLAEHPATMTHAVLDPQDRSEFGITDSMVRLSIGVEHPEDLVRDLEMALAEV